MKKIVKRYHSRITIAPQSSDGIPATYMTASPLGPRKLYGPRRGFRYPRLVENVDIHPKVKMVIPPAARNGDRSLDCGCLPPWNYEPFNAKPFDKIEFHEFSAGDKEAVICEITVPDGHYARISAFGQNLDDSTAWSSWLWRPRVNGLCIYQFAPEISVQQIGRIFDPTEVFFIAQEGAKIDVWTKSNPYAPGYPIIAYARIKGWFWPNTK